MLEEIEVSKRRRVDFGFEATLEGRTYLRVIERLKERGYRVPFFTCGYQHAREGLPMYNWRDGRVVGVPAEELRKRS
jgi:hypothetical protein